MSNSTPQPDVGESSLDTVTDLYLKYSINSLKPSILSGLGRGLGYALRTVGQDIWDQRYGLFAGFVYGVAWGVVITHSAAQRR